ncbi:MULTISPECIES: MerR family transcriptional regulator [unclassified Nocardia]|uniref:MerR family transcriptional regulator n=1 Tax=unclassified Nocardia TaxID=2637762 RepID=UPI001CE483E6|nr:MULTISPECIES: MerR family transcriptional regulator [unclassified Nocardia]
MTQGDSAGERTWRSGELARETGVTVRALHHYDRLGLLSPSSRTTGGHRCYDGADVRRLHRIIALRSFGFALDEIAALLDAGPDDPRGLLEQQLALVDERIADAVKLRARLLDVLGRLDRLVEPSTTQFLRMIEVTIAMDRPLTPERLAEMSRARAEYRQSLSDAELAALQETRAAACAAMSEEERERLHEQRRRMLPTS